MGTIMLVQFLVFATTVSIGSTASLPKTTGIYTFELCGGRSKCSKQPEYLGFNNMTCDHGVPPKSESYGNTVGPLLRETGGESHLWKWWNVTVTGTSTSGATKATIKNAFPKNKGKPNCLGYYMTDYYHYRNKKACNELPWAERVHLHKESRPWEFVAVPGTDCFNIIDDAKPKGCLKFLSASAACPERYMHLVGADNGSGLQRWRLVAQPNSQPPSPKPSASPSPPVDNKAPPPPVPKATAPLLLAVGASSTTSGSIVFQPTPGATSCTVTLTAPGKPTATSTITSLSYPQTSFYPVNLSPDLNYGVALKCLLPGNKYISAPNTQVLHTPTNNGQPTVINFVPTSSTSGNLTIIPPDPLFCKATSYVVGASGGNGRPITINSTSTVVEVKGLSPGVTYSILVQAVCEGGRLTAPMDPLYLTPPKNARPTPSPSPSPSPGKPPASPGGKVPPPPALKECTQKPGLEVVAVSGSLVTVNVKAPQPVGKSNVLIAVDCVYADGTETEADTGNWIPASDPNTSLQIYVPMNAGGSVKCEVIAAVEQLGQIVPVLCPIEEGNFTLSADKVTPGLQLGRTTSSGADITLVKPMYACSGLEYVVRARSTNSSGPSQVVTVDALSASLTGLLPGQYQVTVSGRCPDGTETPENQPVTLNIPCDTAKNYQPDPVNGQCVCKDGYQVVNGACVQSTTPCKPVVGCAADSLTCSSGTSTCSKCLDSNGFDPIPAGGVCVCKVGFTLDAATSTCKSNASSCSPSEYRDNSGKCQPCVLPPSYCPSEVLSCSSNLAADTKCGACKTGYKEGLQATCKKCLPTIIPTCTSYKCDASSGTTICEACGPNSSVDASKTKCVCNPGFADLDRKADNGCEPQLLPPSPTTPVTKSPDVSKPPARENPPVFYTKCYSQGNAFTFGPLPAGVDSKVYAVDRITNPISSLVVPKGYQVTLYAGGTPSGSDVTGSLFSKMVTCSNSATTGQCLDAYVFPVPVDPLTTIYPELSGNVDFVKVEYSDSNCGPPKPVRQCNQCDPDNPDLCELVYQPVQCYEDAPYCITFVDNHADGTKTVTRGCGNYQRCFTEWYQGTSDEDKCRGSLSAQQSLAFTCTFCCITELCNDNLRPAENTLFQIN